MRTLRYLVLLLIFAIIGCQKPHDAIQAKNGTDSMITDTMPPLDHSNKNGGALLLPNFKSLEDLKSVVQITYGDKATGATGAGNSDQQVSLNYNCRGKKMISTLKPGVNETDFLNARKSKLWGRLRLLFVSPYTIIHKADLERIEILSRRRDHIFGEGDVAFYDLAETMVYHISEEDVLGMSCEELSEKGYLNTFNHVVAQAFMTTIFTETLADFVGDVHERSRIPELITGKFTKAQLEDINDGAVDNYLDMINNEAGQELGKTLRKKYGITRDTYWTPELLADYLNDIQSYHSWAFQIGFIPYRPTDETVIRFASKINRVIEDISGLRRLK